MSQKIQVDINQFVGMQVRTIRFQQDLEQRELARRLNISTGTFSKIEHGQIDINMHRLKQIAAALQVDIDRLLPDTISEKVAAAEKKITEYDLDIARLQLIVHDLELRLQKNPGSNVQ